MLTFIISISPRWYSLGKKHTSIPLSNISSTLSRSVKFDWRNKYILKSCIIKRLQFEICQEFSLIDRRELAPLQELIDKLANKEGRWTSCRGSCCCSHFISFFIHEALKLSTRVCCQFVLLFHKDLYVGSALPSIPPCIFITHTHYW